MSLVPAPTTCPEYSIWTSAPATGCRVIASVTVPARIESAATGITPESQQQVIAKALASRQIKLDATISRSPVGYCRTSGKRTEVRSRIVRPFEDYRVSGKMSRWDLHCNWFSLLHTKAVRAITG